MGLVQRPDKVKLIVGLLSRKNKNFKKIKSSLEKIFGKADFESQELDFTHTDYYTAEMGNGLKRRFLSFEKLLGLNDIWKVKVKTNLLESRFLKSGKRTINIDPGYITLSKLVLFSTKDFTHRIYLNKGIFAEVTLFYKDGTFNSWPWTYPDYRTEDYIKIFNSIRNIYKEKIAEP